MILARLINVKKYAVLSRSEFYNQESSGRALPAEQGPNLEQHNAGPNNPQADGDSVRRILSEFRTIQEEASNMQNRFQRAHHSQQTG